MREPIFLLTVWSAIQFTSCGVDCPFGGRWRGKIDRCLASLRIKSEHLSQMILLDGKTPKEIEDICDTADIEGAIDCAERVLNEECKWKEVTPQTRFLSFDGIKKGLLFTCKNRKVQKRSQACARLQVDSFKNCTTIQTKISNEKLKSAGRYKDFSERICSKYRIEYYCYNAIYRNPCGDEIADFRIKLNEYLTPPACDCNTQSFLRSRDSGECIDQTGCLFHIADGMTEYDLYKGVLFGTTNLDEAWQMCSHSEEGHTVKFVEAMKCLKKSNRECNYKIMKYKMQKTNMNHLNEAAVYMCDRWQILVTKEEKEKCLFSKLHDYNDCVVSEQTKAGLGSKLSMKDNLKLHVCDQHKAKIRCIYRTFSKCSFVLANVLEGVLMRMEPPICRWCRRRGTFPYTAGSNTQTGSFFLIVILAFYALFSTCLI